MASWRTASGLRISGSEQEEEDAEEMVTNDSWAGELNGRGKRDRNSNLNPFTAVELTPQSQPQQQASLEPDQGSGALARRMDPVPSLCALCRSKNVLLEERGAIGSPSAVCQTKTCPMFAQQQQVTTNGKRTKRMRNKRQPPRLSARRKK